MKTTPYELLTPVQRTALDQAVSILETAYNPYSHFRVGAVLYTDDGTFVGGSNVESVSFTPTICAERSAVARANAMGMRIFSGIAVIARGDDFDTREVTAPCGVCRQVLYELSQVSGTDLTVILSSTDKERIVVTSISELLPMPFGPSDLGIDVSKHRR